jgi:4-amino-4-deoxy-L-arabinose transferase-like glycosyltransferase
MSRELQCRLAVAGLLLLTYGLATTSASVKSPTMDEQNHIARGLAYLGTGDPRLSVEHPPLLNLINALPAHLLLEVDLPLDDWWEAGEWYHFADNLFWRGSLEPDQIVFLARLPSIALGLVLVTVVFRWSASLFGPRAGVLSAAVLALDPNVLAHMRFSTTDVGGALLVLLAGSGLWLATRKPSWRSWLGTCVAFGLAFSAKLSALLFGPIMALVLLLDGVAQGPDGRRRLGRRAILFAALMVGAGVIVWAVYGFEMGAVGDDGPVLPAPRYVEGVGAILSLSGGGRPAYLMGEISERGWWYYFPVAFLVKTPLPTLALIAAAGIYGLRTPRRRDLFLLLPPIAYFLVSMASSLNIGYRHLLPMLPFLAVHSGRLLRRRPLEPAGGRPGLRSALVALALTWLAASSLAIYPDYLAYFNALGGGPDNGWRLLVDSNIDWGQDLKQLRAWMEEQGVGRVKLAWFGSAYPDAYGIAYDPLPGVGFGSHFELWSDPPFDADCPEPGIYVISATNLAGVALPDHNLYEWFRDHNPDEKIGYSLFVYRVDI